MEFAPLTFERVLLVLTFVLFFAFVVVNTVQQRHTQAELKEIKQQTQGTQVELKEIKQRTLKEIKQQMQGTLAELKQFKEDVPHREFSSLARGSMHLPLLPSRPLTKQRNSLPRLPFCLVIRRSVYGDV